jgi:hypothetical protein
MKTLRDPELRTLVPACSVKHKNDLFVWAGSHFLSKNRPDLAEGFDAHREQEKSTGLPALRMHKGIHIHPLIALSHDGFDGSSLGSPYVARSV